MRCALCRYFEIGEHAGLKNWPGSGRCNRWYQSYYEDATKMLPNDCWIESDEGWCNVVGPEFGCVLFEPKPDQPEGR